MAICLLLANRIRSIRQKPALQCYAAADAMAKAETFGIGGWLITSSHCSWFSELSEARTLWPQLQDTAQRYIACFETLAQLALAMVAHRTCSAKQWSFTLPSASDNAPTEAGLDNSGAPQSHWAPFLSWQQLGLRGMASSSWLPTWQGTRIFGQTPCHAIACTPSESHA